MRGLLVLLLTLAGVSAGVLAQAEEIAGTRSEPHIRSDKWPETTNGRQKEAAGTDYFWRSSAMGAGAQLVTLFCRNCYGGSAAEIPVVSVLRDTAGDDARENDRISYVWLLSAPHVGAGQRALSAVPFFFWRVGRGSDQLTSGDLKPQLNLTSPQDPMMSGFTRQLVQWTAFDPLAVWVRAPSRSYQANASDNSRFNLEETISYLRHAPASNDGESLSEAELKTVIARLELRKSLMGGLVDNRHAARFGDEWGFEQERVRSRNWEMLRQCAEKTGLQFEPVDLGGISGQYGILWYQEDSRPPASGTSLKPIWKLLNIGDPWQDVRMRNWDGLSFHRDLDEDGRLLPAGAKGAQTVRLIPMALYSLTYPKLPLLLVDFRDKLHIRRHEMTQRSINQITSGVIGISRLTNWYYYVGAMAYNFVSSRHGAAVSQAQRLDSYAQFRVHLALDGTLDRRLYNELERHADSLTVSPMDSTGKHAVELAQTRYAMLLAQAQPGSPLSERLARDRRAELARFGQSPKAEVGHGALHMLTVGLYTQRVGKDELNLGQLDRERRFTYALNYLGTAVKNGTEPEVSYNASEIAASVAELTSLSTSVKSSILRNRATATLRKVSELTKDQAIVADCRQGLAALNMGPSMGTPAAQQPEVAESKRSDDGADDGPMLRPLGSASTSGSLVRGLK